MPVQSYTILVDAGTDFTQTFLWHDSSDAAVNLTGYTARMKIRPAIGSSTTTLSLTNGSGITLGGALGTVIVAMTAAQTTTLTAPVYFYDLELVSGSGAVTRLLEGRIIVDQEVTT